MLFVKTSDFPKWNSDSKLNLYEEIYRWTYKTSSMCSEIKSNAFSTEFEIYIFILRLFRRVYIIVRVYRRIRKIKYCSMQ